MQFQDALRDDKTEARSGSGAFAAAVHAIVTVKEVRDIFRCNPGARVRNTHPYPVLLTSCLNMDRTAFGRMPEGVIDQVFEHSLDEPDIGLYLRKIVSRIHVKGYSLQVSGKSEFLQDILNKLVDREGLGTYLDISRVKLCEFEKRRNQLPQPLRMFYGRCNVISLLVVREPALLHEQGFQIPLERGERGPEVVRNVGDKFPAEPVRFRQALDLVSDPVPSRRT